MRVISFIISLAVALGVNGATGGAPRISLVTAEPGPEIFELYGHQAVRVVTPQGADLIYNFGLFDFDESGFVYRFLKGETDYLGGVCPTGLFLSGYERRGSRVVEQVLNLTDAEAARMMLLLNDAVSPANATYRYRYCTNNCATRVLDILDSSLTSPVVYPDTVDSRLDTYRKVMRHYNRNYPWYQAGIDVALGSGIDEPIGGRERMFVPVQLMKAAAVARIADGRQLVGATHTLVEGRGDVTQPPTPLLLSPLFWACVVFLFTVVAVCCAMRRGWRRWSWWASLLWGLTGVAGCLSWFLIFISEHEATSPNIIGWWLNPLWLVPAFTIHKLRRFTTWALIVTGIMSLVTLSAWIAGVQAINASLLVMCVTSLVLSTGYLLTVFLHRKQS